MDKIPDGAVPELENLKPVTSNPEVGKYYYVKVKDIFNEHNDNNYINILVAKITEEINNHYVIDFMDDIKHMFNTDLHVNRNGKLIDKESNEITDADGSDIDINYLIDTDSYAKTATIGATNVSDKYKLFYRPNLFGINDIKNFYLDKDFKPLVVGGKKGRKSRRNKKSKRNTRRRNKAKRMRGGGRR